MRPMNSGSARVSRAAEGVPPSALLILRRKIRFGETPKRTRETRALPFNPRKERHRFSDNVTIRQLPPLRIGERKTLFFTAQVHLPIQLIENSVCRLRQDR